MIPDRDDGAAERRARTRAAAAAGLLVVALGAAGASPFAPSPGPVAAQSRARTFYVATDGNDAHNGLAPAFAGGSKGPFRTFPRAARAVKAGDTVQIRGGTYVGYGGTWGYAADGTASDPITITAYPGETVVIDGADRTLPENPYTPLMQIYGDWYVVSDLELRSGSYAGLNIAGDHCLVRNVTCHHNRGPGIFASGRFNTIEGCRAYSNSMANEHGVLSIGWDFGISLCAGARRSTVRACTAWNNWGEGISIASGYDCTIEDCVAYDNFSVNIYICQSVGGVCRRNLSYYTAGNPLQRFASSQNCIYVGDEGKPPDSSGNRVLNNLCLGGDRCLLVSGDDFDDTLVAHNTFVNAFHRRGRSDGACVYFLAGASTGGRFVNNIVLQEDGVPVSHLEAVGVAFDHNSWSRRPVPACRGEGDVIGNPRLLKNGPTDPGSLRREWFMISVVSPVRGQATPLKEVSEDAGSRPRAARPDMGAYEFRLQTKTTFSPHVLSGGQRVRTASSRPSRAGGRNARSSPAGAKPMA